MGRTASTVGVGLGSSGVVTGVTPGAGTGMGVGRTVEVGTAAGDGKAVGRGVAVGGVVGLGSGVCGGIGDDVGGTEVVVGTGLGMSVAACSDPQAGPTTANNARTIVKKNEAIFHIGIVP